MKKLIDYFQIVLAILLLIIVITNFSYLSYVNKIVLILVIIITQFVLSFVKVNILNILFEVPMFLFALLALIPFLGIIARSILIFASFLDLMAHLHSDTHKKNLAKRYTNKNFKQIRQKEKEAKKHTMNSKKNVVDADFKEK
jgi:predicted membrane protein